MLTLGEAARRGTTAATIKQRALSAELEAPVAPRSRSIRAAPGKRLFREPRPIAVRPLKRFYGAAMASQGSHVKNR